MSLANETVLAEITLAELGGRAAAYLAVDEFYMTESTPMWDRDSVIADRFHHVGIDWSYVR